MIVEWWYQQTAGLLAFFGGLFPKNTVPAWFTGLDTTVNDWFKQWDGLGVWAPWVFLGTVVGVVLAWWLGGFVIKLIRVLIAHLPVSGGSG